jgi:hypothetical protein
MGFALDLIGLILISIGISLNWLGHHYFGPVLFWGGVVFNATGLYLIARTIKRQRDIEKSLINYRGPGDYGDTHYHRGADHHSGHESSGSDSSSD